MATDISTLGVTYGSPISGESLGAILNGATDQIAITGEVVYNSGLTIDLPTLDIVGTGSLSYASGSTPTNTIKRFASIDGVDITGDIRIPLDATATGIIKNNSIGGLHFSTNDYGYAPVDLAGLRFDTVAIPTIIGPANGVSYSGCTFAGRVLTAGSRNTYDLCDFDAGNSRDVCHKFYTNQSLYSSVGNIVKNSTFAGATQEAVGYDVADWSTLATVSEVGSNYVVLSCVYFASRVTGGSVVGQTAAILNGSGIGKYFSITDQDVTKIWLDTSRFTTGGISVGDYVQINKCAVDCLWENNTVAISNNNTQASYFGQNTAISFHGPGQGNIARGNSITVTSTIRTHPLIMTNFFQFPYYNTFTETWEVPEYNCQIGNRNQFLDNDITWSATPHALSTDVIIQMNGGDWDENAEQIIIKTVGENPVALRAYGNVAIGNTSTNPRKCGVKDCISTVWSNPGLATPSILYEAYGTHPDVQYSTAATAGTDSGTTYYTDSSAPVSASNRTAGEYPSGTLITLTAEDFISHPTIYYQWDSGGFTAYTVPIIIQAGTLEVYAVDALGNEESPQSFVYTEILSFIKDRQDNSITLKTRTGQTITPRYFIDGAWQ